MFANLDRKKIVIYGLVGLVCLGVARIVLSIVDKPEPPSIAEQPSPYGELSSETVELTFVGEPLTLPKSLPTYSVTTPDLNEIAAVLANNLGMSQHEAVASLWQSPGKIESLSVNSHTGTIDYSLYDPTRPLETGIDPDQARAAALSFVQRLGLDVAEQVATSGEPEYFAADLDAVETNREQAAYAAFYFAQKLNGFPLFYDTQTSRTMTVWVRNDNRVTKMAYTPPPSSPQAIGEVQLIDFDTALGRVKRGDARVIALYNSGNREEVNVEDFDKVELTQAWLEYRVNLITNKAEPHVHFVGVAEGSQGIFDIEAIVSAI